MNWCTTCGAQYDGPIHNCGYATITQDRLRELRDIERESRHPDQPTTTQEVPHEHR